MKTFSMRDLKKGKAIKNKSIDVRMKIKADKVTVQFAPRSSTEKES